MPKTAALTRQKILDVTADMLAAESLGNLNMDRIGHEAGLTKKSLYYHFPSKDHLITATAEHMREDYLTKCRAWFSTSSETESFRQRALIATHDFAESAKQPAWKGCCFIRITAELASLPGHPVHDVIRGAKRDMEHWFEGMLAKDGCPNAARAARQMVIFVNGLVLMMLQDRSGSGVPDALELLKSIIPVASASLPLAA